MMHQFETTGIDPRYAPGGEYYQGLSTPVPSPAYYGQPYTNIFSSNLTIEICRHEKVKECVTINVQAHELLARLEAIEKYGYFMNDRKYKVYEITCTFLGAIVNVR